jgi:hypothetical protein
MEIDCYREGRNLTPVIGDTDINKEPTYPTADKPPDDPIEVAQEAVWDCQNTIKEYDGCCYEGEKSVKPGVNYKQPVYREIWCESDTIQPDLLKFQSELEVVDDVIGWNVKVVTSKGMPSVPFMYENCKRLQENVVDKYPHIKKIVILWFGDPDDSGGKIRKCVENGVNWYCSGDSPDLHVTIPIDVRHIAVTEEQVKKYKLTGSQLEAFLNTDKRLKQFKGEVLLPALKKDWNEDVYYENCPPEKYDYEANDEEEPREIDPDNDTMGDIYSDATEEERRLLIRDKMIQIAIEGFSADSEWWVKDDD